MNLHQKSFKNASRTLGDRQWLAHESLTVIHMPAASYFGDVWLNEHVFKNEEFLWSVQISRKI
jgi:hypothetical protein